MRHVKQLVALVAMLPLLLLAQVASGQTDPLPAWNEGPAKAIMDFVGKVTREGSPDFVKPAERIAAFDNDGTLWAEQPAYFQALFAFDEIKRLVAAQPELKTKSPYKSVLACDLKALGADGNNGLMQVLAKTHSGMTTEAFAASVGNWLSSARHPTTQRSSALMRRRRACTRDPGALPAIAAMLRAAIRNPGFSR